MADRLYVHIVWTTRQRARLIDAPIATFLRRFLPAVAREERTEIIEIGIVRTHVHVLARLHPTTSIPVLLQRLKGGSSVIASREEATLRGHLRWAKGYGIHSVSPRNVNSARDYVRSQALRHPGEAIEEGAAVA